ncbi:QRFP-like peptide receptor [Oculina patagonica]
MSYSNTTEYSSDNETDFQGTCDDLNNRTAEIGKAIACAFIFITSILGNTMVVIVVYRERRMRTTVNFLIVNMAVSDFLCTVFVIPRIITQLFTYQAAWLITGPVADALCRIVHFFQDVTVAVSLLTLLMIAIERYYAISCPVAANPIPRKRCGMMIVLTWLVSFLMYATRFWTFKLSIEEEGSFCYHSWEHLVGDPLKAREIEFLLHTILSVIIPFIAVTSFYTTILIKIRRISVPDDVSSLGPRRQQKRNRNVLRMLLAVVIAFGFCWFPFIIYTYVATFVWINRSLEVPCGVEIFGQFALYLAYFQSSINPAIYLGFSENYRQGLKKIIWPCLSPITYKRSDSKQIETPQFKNNKRRFRHVSVVRAQDVELRSVHNR